MSCSLRTGHRVVGHFGCRIQPDPRGGRIRLIRRLGAADEETMERADEGIQISLGLVRLGDVGAVAKLAAPSSSSKRPQEK